MFSSLSSYSSYSSSLCDCAAAAAAAAAAAVTNFWGRDPAAWKWFLTFVHFTRGFFAILQRFPHRDPVTPTLLMTIT